MDDWEDLLVWLVFGVLWLTAGCSTPTAPSADVGLDLQTLLFVRSNEAREAGGPCGQPAEGLQADARLMQAAQQHAESLDSGLAFRHSTNQFMLHVGARAENIAWVNVHAEDEAAAVESLVYSWVHSQAHCRHLLNPKWTGLGVGVARKNNRMYGVQLFN